MALTVKQEAFARMYVECGNASEAYREVYNVKTMSDRNITEEAKRLKQNPSVAPFIKSLQAKIAEKHEITVDYLNNILKEAYVIATNNDDASNVRGSAMDMGKLNGLITDKKIVTFDGEIKTHQSSIFDRFVDRIKEKK